MQYFLFTKSVRGMLCAITEVCKDGDGNSFIPF